MSEKKKSAGGRVRLLKIGCALTLVLFGPFLLLYTWFAVRPTGYEALAGRMEEAEAAIQRRFEASVASVGRDVLTTRPILAARAGSNELTSGPLPEGEARMEQVSLGEQLAADWPRGAVSHLPSAWQTVMPSHSTRWYVWSRYLLGSLQFVDKHPDRAPELDLPMQTKIVWRIKQSSGRLKDSLRTVSRRDALTADARSKLAEGMQRAERLLLGEHPATEGMTADQIVNWQWSIQEPTGLGLLAMLRAAGLGDSAKGEALLRGHLAAIQELRLASFPYGSAPFGWTTSFITPIMWGARIPEISDDALARADAQLAGFILTPEELEQFRVVYARRATDMFASRVEADQVPSGIDVFNYFFEGGPERGWRRTMGPVLKNHLERLTVAWAGSDMKAWEAAEREQLRLLPWLNVKWPGAISHFYSRGDNSVQERAKLFRLARGGFNDEIVEARMVLAAERYRRRHGEYPRSMEALNGDYPYVGELSTPDLQCSILWLDELRILELPYPRDGESDPYERIWKAVGLFQNTGKLLESAEDLLPYLESEKDLKEVNQFFVNYPGRPVFCFTRRELDHGLGTEEMLAVNALFPINPQIPDWLREAVSEKSSE